MPGGFPALVKRFWLLFKGEVMEIFDGIYYGRDTYNRINETILVPIPNKARARFLVEVRSTSLANTIYKFIFKILASRLRQVLDKLAGDC